MAPLFSKDTKDQTLGKKKESLVTGSLVRQHSRQESQPRALTQQLLWYSVLESVQSYPTNNCRTALIVEVSVRSSRGLDLGVSKKKNGICFDVVGGEIGLDRLWTTSVPRIFHAGRKY